MPAGLFIALAAAAAFEVSYVLQALEARGESSALGLRASLLGRLIRNPRWVGATLLTVCGGLLQLWALSLAPVTVVQPALAVGLLALPLLANVTLHERPRPRELAGVAAIVAGVAVIALFGPTSVGRRPATAGLVIALVLLGLVVLAPYALRGRGTYYRLAIASAAAGDAMAALGLKLAADQLHASNLPLALAWLAMAVVSAALGLTAEMTALQRMRATTIAPVVVAMQVLVPVAMGLLFLGDSWRHTPGGGLLLGAALAVLLGGAVLLASSRTIEEALGVAPEDELGGGGQSGE